MAEAAGLRNVIAHEYGAIIDDGVVYNALQDLSRYRAFLAAGPAANSNTNTRHREAMGVETSAGCRGTSAKELSPRRANVGQR